jgi:hypothetical protein
MATTGNLVSLKMIADRLMRNPINKDLQWEFIVDNAIEILRILDSPNIYVKRIEGLQVDNYRALKPIDIMKIRGVFYMNDGCKVNTDNNNALAAIGSGNYSSNGLVRMTQGQDTLHDSYPSFNGLSGSNSGEASAMLTYSVNSKYVITNFEKGKILISYDAIATDEECYPLVYNDATLLRCVESYIKWKWYDILNDIEVISDRKLNKVERDYMFNVAQAANRLILPNEDEMESITSQITTLIPNNTQWQERFQFLGQQERLKIH